MFDRILRHWDVIKASWGQESERRKNLVKVDDADFLPAALEIMERPPSPLGRATAWAIGLFMLIALVWASLGRVDVVATAQGKLAPREHVKLIQPVDYGVVREILVNDGQSVKAGDVLVALDPTASSADEEQARHELMVARIDQARGEALLRYLDSGEIELELPDGISASTSLMQRQLIDAHLGAYKAQEATLKQQRLEAEADLGVVLQEIAKLTDTLPLIEEQLAARKELSEKGLSPRFVYLELQERFVSARQNLEIQREQIDKMQAAIAAIDRQVDQLRSEFREQIVVELTTSEDKVDMLSEGLRKASQRRQLQQLKSPVDGVVQQLAIHTVGGVVQPAQALMVVVPGDGELVLDAKLLNRDIGFVETGDPVEVKLEAFPFTTYGVLNGVLEDISTDAIQDENQGLVYQARVRLLEDRISVGDKEVNLTSGMAATVEVKIGQRRIIEFLLSPLLRYKQESFRER
ncbi:type I secretion membrane fusion protein, HlyD family [Rhodobacteraceae bacterium KLH11]|nr:type I secretion membrane fusion protein, HlyD family [Rhodobacteraceae bacterium KLH11]